MNKNNKMAEGYKDFIAGTVGGFSAKLFDYPFDTVKVLLQTQNSLPSTSASSAGAATVESTASTAASLKSATPVYRSAIHCLKYQIETRGFLSLYQGLSAPLLGSMAENAVLFLFYGEIKRMLGENTVENKELSLLQLATAGGVAGAFGAFALNPFEVIKVQMQVTNSAANSTSGAAKKYTGVIDCVRQTVKSEGIIKGLYRGQSSLLWREIPGNFCWYGVYEGVCMTQIPEGGTKRDLGMSTHLLGGASAGVAYWTAFYPADTVGSQMRANPEYASKKFMDVFKDVYKKEGWLGLYRGWGITAMRAAPAHALLFAMYEQTMGVFRRYDPETVDCIDKRSGSISHGA